MDDVRNTEEQQLFWGKRYSDQSTGWDIGYPSRPLKEYIDQIEDRNQKILIPGAGNAYEAEYLHQEGFSKASINDSIFNKFL